MIGIDHIAIIVSKEENLNFYKKLGFKEIRRITRAYDFVVFMKNGDVILFYLLIRQVLLLKERWK